MRALGRLGDPASAPLLRPWLQKPLSVRTWMPTRDPQIVAIEALGELEDKEAVGALIRLLPQNTAAKDAKGKWSIRDHTEIERALSVMYALQRIADARAVEALAYVAQRDFGPWGVNASGPALNSLPMAAQFALEKCPPGAFRDFCKVSGFKPEFLDIGDRLVPFEDDVSERYAGLLMARSGLPLPKGGDQWISIEARDPASAPALVKSLPGAMRRRRAWSIFYTCRAIGKLGNRAVVPDLVELLQTMKPEGADGGLLNKDYLHMFNGPWKGTPGDDYDGLRPRPKAAICFALGKLKDPRAVPALVEVLRDQRHVFETRQAAAFALGLIADPSSTQALEHARRNDTHMSVKRACDEALQTISGENPWAGVYAELPGYRESLTIGHEQQDGH